MSQSFQTQSIERFTMITNSNAFKLSNVFEGIVAWKLPIEYTRSRNPQKHIKILSFQYINPTGQVEVGNTLHSKDLQEFDDYEYIVSNTNYSYLNTHRFTPSDNKKIIEFLIYDYKLVRILPDVVGGTYQITALLTY